MKTFLVLFTALMILVPSIAQSLVPAKSTIYCDYADPVVEFLKKENYQILVSGIGVQLNGHETFSTIYINKESVLDVIFTPNGLGCFVAGINSDIQLHKLEDFAKKEPS